MKNIVRRSGESKKKEGESPISKKGIRRKEDLLKWAIWRPMTF
jgi:hypothetical protein